MTSRKPASKSDPVTSGILCCKRIDLALAGWDPQSRYFNESKTRVKGDIALLENLIELSEPKCLDQATQSRMAMSNTNIQTLFHSMCLDSSSSSLLATKLRNEIRVVENDLIELSDGPKSANEEPTQDWGSSSYEEKKEYQPAQSHTIRKSVLNQTTATRVGGMVTSSESLFPENFNLSLDMLQTMLDSSFDTPAPPTQIEPAQHTLQKITVFVTYRSETRKMEYVQIETISDVKHLFLKAFLFDASDSSVYIQHPEFKHKYVLEDVRDVTMGSLLAIQDSENRFNLSELNRKMDKAMEYITSSKLSSIQPATSDLAKRLQASMELVHTTRKEYTALREHILHLNRCFYSAMTNATAQIQQLAILQPASKKSFIQETLDSISNESELLEQRLNAYRAMFDTMRIDVKRGAKVTQFYLDEFEDGLTDFHYRTSAFSDKISYTKSTCKVAWEKELQAIVEEQKFLKGQDQYLKSMDEQAQDFREALEQMREIAKHQAALQPVIPEVNVLQPEKAKSEGIVNVITELGIRLPEFSQSQQQRQLAVKDLETFRPLINSTRFKTAFEKELRTFVLTSKLRETGGISAIEWRIQEQQKLFLESMIASKAQ